MTDRPLKSPSKVHLIVSQRIWKNWKQIIVWSARLKKRIHAILWDSLKNYKGNIYGNLLPIGQISSQKISFEWERQNINLPNWSINNRKMYSKVSDLLINLINWKLDILKIKLIHAGFAYVATKQSKIHWFLHANARAVSNTHI